MLKIEHTETYGWETAIRGMRNPLNSWNKSDTAFWCYHDGSFPHVLGGNDYDLMKRLVASGSDHAKFMRMIGVSLDITAPLYWWKEYDTYKVGTVANGCSTMHKIQAKKFVFNDFSHEHLTDDGMEVLEEIVYVLNEARDMYVNFPEVWAKEKDILAPQLRECETMEEARKVVWWQMIQLLPSSYNQKRTVTLNYAVLRNMYHARKNHKLDEWHTFCAWIETLPYSELITMKGDRKNDN